MMRFSGGILSIRVSEEAGPSPDFFFFVVWFFREKGAG